MTVLEAIKKSSEFLERKGIDSPRLQAELLLAHILKLPRLRLYLEFERKLVDTQSEALRDLVVKRANHIPLQHLTGSTSFCGYPISVSPHVLIPRPETETLAEEAWTFLKSLMRPTTFLDLGTGSACLPIAIANHAPQSRGTAVDISPAALEVARKNVRLNKLEDRIELRESNLFSALSLANQFDLIVSNPPYIPTHEIATLQPEVRDHDPKGALDGGADGLDFYRRIAKQAPPFLQSQGRLLLEFGDGQSSALKEIFSANDWKIDAVIRDLSQRERVLIASR